MVWARGVHREVFRHSGNCTGRPAGTGTGRHEHWQLGTAKGEGPPAPSCNPCGSKQGIYEHEQGQV